MQQKSLRIILSGPSAVGKGTIIPFLMKRNDRLRLSKSVTTRPRRPDDTGKYENVEREEFERRIQAGHFLEWQNVHGDLYGTPVQSVHPDTDLLLEIDVRGALQMKRDFKETVHTIFILPPSYQELEQRFRNRARMTGESEESQQRRLETARLEIQHVREFNAWVVNKMVESAAARILQIIMLLQIGQTLNDTFRNESDLERVISTFPGKMVTQ